MKIWKIMVVITLAVALVLGVALPGLATSDVASTQTTNFISSANPPAWGEKFPRIVRGEVSEIGDEFFAIQTMEQPIYVNEGTKYFMVSAPQIARVLHRWQIKLGQLGVENAEPPTPAKERPFRLPRLKEERAGQELTLFRYGRLELAPNLPQPDNGEGMSQGIGAKLKWLRHFGEEATFADLEIGYKVVALLVPGKDKPTAKVVLIIKPSVWGRIAGTITGVSDDSITIEPVSGGDEVTLEYTGGTVFILKGIISVEEEAEQFARAVYNTETMIAKVVRVWPEAPQLSD